MIAKLIKYDWIGWLNRFNRLMDNWNI